MNLNHFSFRVFCILYFNLKKIYIHNGLIRFYGAININLGFLEYYVYILK